MYLLIQEISRPIQHSSSYATHKAMKLINTIVNQEILQVPYHAFDQRSQVVEEDESPDEEMKTQMNQ